MRAVELDRPLGPRLRREPGDAAVLDHLGPPVLRRPLHLDPGDDDAALVGPLAARHRRIDRDHHPVRARSAPRRRAASSIAQRPERARRRRSRTRRRAPPARGSTRRSAPSRASRKPGARCIRFAAVGARVTAVPGAASSSSSSGVPRRRRRHHRPRPRPEPQRELQHVPGVARLLPLADLVAPGAVELRPAQALGIARRENLRHRAVRPDQPPPASPATRAAGPAASRPGSRRRRRPSPPAPRRASRRPGRPGNIVPGSPGLPPSTCARIHSAPARVLPAPRPPRMTQVVQSPSGGSWCPSAQCSKSQGRDIRAFGLNVSRKPSSSPAAAQTASLATISARAASRSSAMPAPPSVALVRFPRPASISRTVCNAFRCSRTASAITLAVVSRFPLPGA